MTGLRDKHHDIAGRPGKLRSEFYFNLEPLPGSRFPDGIADDYCRFKRDFFAGFDVKMSDKFWTGVPTDHPRLAELAEAMASLKREGTAQPVRGGLYFWLEDDPNNPLEWFVVSPRGNFPTDGWPNPTIKACNVQPGKHVGGSAWSFYVSETVKDIIHAEGLVGCELLWLPDKGKYRAPQWFHAEPLLPLGRGIDHPAFDWEIYKNHVRSGAGVFRLKDSSLAMFDETERADVERAYEKNVQQAKDTDFSTWRRYGCRYFEASFLRSGWTFGVEAVDAVSKVFDPNELSIGSFARLLRPFIPEADFGFISYETGPNARDSGDNHRCFCINRRAKEIFIDAGVLRPEECEGILVLDEVPEGSEVLDRREWPIPVPDKHWLEAQRDKLEKELAAYLQKPKPVRQASLTRSLAALRQLKKTHPDRFGKRGSSKKIDGANAALPNALPAAWEKTLKTVDGFEWFRDDDSSVIVSACADLPGVHQSFQEIIVDLDGSPRGEWLHVGHFDDGDFLTLDLSAVDEKGECPVIRVSHETHETDHRWESVAAFLEDWMS